MANGESNGHVTQDVTWPRKVKSWPPICLESNIAKTATVCYGGQIVSVVGVDAAILCQTEHTRAHPTQVLEPSTYWSLHCILKKREVF